MALHVLRYSLSRGQRLAVELPPWIPAIAGSLGFTMGIAVLAVDVSAWFFFLVLIPLVLYRGLFAILIDLVIHSGKPVELTVDEGDLHLQRGDERLSLPLTGIIQVFRSGQSWTVLHLRGEVLTIPADAIAEEQIEYLKSFARIAAAERKADRAE